MAPRARLTLTTQRLSLRQALENDLFPITMQLRILNTDLSGLRISAGYVTRSDNSARLSIEPQVGRLVAPRSSRNMALALVLGLMLAAGAALLKESFRGVINEASDLAAIAPDIPLLSEIPEFGRRTAEPLDLAADAATPYAQSIERLVTSLLYERLSYPGRQMSVLVTSSIAGVGKTTVASHLAVRLDATRSRTILIDGDLRRPDIHRVFGQSQSFPGLSGLLEEGAELGPHLHGLDWTSKTKVLFAGRGTDDAAALLRETFPAAVRSLKDEYDLLVVDAPPVLAVTDAEVMSKSIDVVLVAVRVGETTRSQLKATLSKLHAANASIIGFALVGAKASGGYGYSYSYDAAVSRADRSAPQPFVAEREELPQPEVTSDSGAAVVDLRYQKDLPANGANRNGSQRNDSEGGPKKSANKKPLAKKQSPGKSDAGSANKKPLAKKQSPGKSDAGSANKKPLAKKQSPGKSDAGSAGSAKKQSLARPSAEPATSVSKKTTDMVKPVDEDESLEPLAWLDGDDSWWADDLRPVPPERQ